MTTASINNIVGTSIQRQTTSSQVDYNSFLRLLVAQLQNQDPTNPTDSSEYLAQLASFSSVEQAIQANGKLDNLISATNIQIGANLIGKTVAFPESATQGTVIATHFNNGSIFVELEGGDIVALTQDMIVR